MSLVQQVSSTHLFFILTHYLSRYTRVYMCVYYVCMYKENSIFHVKRYEISDMSLFVSVWVGGWGGIEWWVRGKVGGLWGEARSMRP